ncbi:MAG: two-component regulator propeller domain-containing protein [Pseudomonadota bacterium]
MQFKKTLAMCILAGLGLVLGCSKSNGANPVSASSAVPAAQTAPAQQGKVQVDPTQKFTHFRVGEKNVKSIYADGKIMWIGTSGGVIRYDTTDDSYKVFDTSNGLLSTGAFFLNKIKGHIAVGTYGGGMSVLQDDGVTWKNYNIPQGVGDPFVYGIIEVANGDIWIATWSGVNRVRGGALDDPSKWDLFTIESTNGGVPNDWVYGVAEGKNGEIWLATEGGVARFLNGKWDNWNHAKGIGAPYEKVKDAITFKGGPGGASEHHAQQMRELNKGIDQDKDDYDASEHHTQKKKEIGMQTVDVAYNPNYIISLVVDRNGDVWAGTWGGGLSRFDGKTWKTYTTADGLPGNHIFMLHKDVNEQIWIGTNKGLALWQDGKFKVMTRADGLLSDDVFSMATTKDGGKWLGSYGGVTYLRP